MAEVLDVCVEKMNKSTQALKDEYNTIRTGRASASLFDKVRVDYYGEKTPLSQVATVSIPEARMVVVQPWDKTLITEIEKAILKSELGLNPSNDGKVIRISIPPLTADRRKELVKQVKKMAEDSKVAVRNIRRDALDGVKKLKKDGLISEDDEKRFENEIQKLTDDAVKKIDGVTADDCQNDETLICAQYVVRWYKSVFDAVSGRPFGHSCGKI